MQHRISDEVHISSGASFLLSILKVFRGFHNYLIFPLQVKGNAVLQTNLEKRKKALHERRLALEQDVCSVLENSFIFHVFSLVPPFFLFCSLPISKGRKFITFYFFFIRKIFCFSLFCPPFVGLGRKCAKGSRIRSTSDDSISVKELGSYLSLAT